MFCSQALCFIIAVTFIKIHLSESTFRCIIFPEVKHLTKYPSSATTILNCSFIGVNSVDAVNWTRNGQPVKEGNIHNNNKWSAVVFVDITRDQDLGEFTCAAKSGQEVSSCSASPSKPKLLNLEPVKIVEVRRSPKIWCEAIGWPTPRVSWWRSGSRISADNDYFSTYILESTTDSILSLKVIDIDEDQHGTYTCRADNLFGTSVGDINIMIKRDDLIQKKSDQQFPSVALEGKNATLECICNKDECQEDTANAYWEFKKHYVNQSAMLRLSKTILVSNVKILMTIINVSRTDEGEYICGINTSRGFEERERLLRVLTKDSFPRVLTPSRYVYANLQSQVTLQCNAIYPIIVKTKTEIVWKFNNTLIPKDSQHYQQKDYGPRNGPNSTKTLPFEIHISNVSVQDFGWYICGVNFKFNVGMATTKIFLSLKMEKNAEAKEDVKQSGSKNVMPLVAIFITTGGIMIGFVVAYIAYRLCRNKRNTDEPLFEAKVNGRQFRYDVFVTFSSQDLNWVRKELIPLVENHKLNYCIHDRDFEIGKPVVDNMAESVYTSRKVLAVVSHNYMSSRFCRGELEMALYRSTEMCDSSVIVIRIDGVDRSELPKAIRNRTFLDYNDFTERKNWKERLIKHLKPPPIDKCPEKNSWKLYSTL